MIERKKFTPWGYQKLIAAHILEHPKCAVWSFMGSGKTSASLTALSGLHLAGEDHPSLVLAPKRVARSTWPDESLKWNHLRHIDVSPITGDEPSRHRALMRDVSVFTMNYENLPWLIQHFDGKPWPFKTVIADESTRLKGFRLEQGGVQTEALGRVSHLCERFIQLTGTPAPNGLADLWGQMWFLDGGIKLGRTYKAFRNRWFQKSFDGYGSVPLPHAQDEIQALLKDICITIDAKDWFNLDDPIVRDVWVDMPIKSRKLYREMEKDMYIEIEGRGVEAFNAASRTQKLLQLANGAIYVDHEADNDDHPKAKEWRMVHDEKIEALESIVYESGGAPILVAYQFKSDLARILRAFPQARHLDDDPKTEHDWNKGKIPMLVAHPKSAGHGLNLQDGGNILVRFGVNWNLEQHDQIIERIGPVRQMQSGHKRPVFEYRILARDTVDEDVLDRLVNKCSVQDTLLQSMRRKR